eukprot:TRINITY_DN3889_c0_g1_i1.p1 TRINITY_DN3889_c0_g1~~TRINITY_DN3889_c0_g1_i1.p1  ORF type:complete len:377 (-),score=34.35 TRINITY_DN3889_c0_g1_i1:174-1304(-)
MGDSQVITCKAAVCWGPEEALTIEEIEVEAPRSSEVRIKMLCASLCHTDILHWNAFPIGLFPRVMGHEGVGVVESLGEGVTEVKEGDIVIPTYIGECKACDNCKSGKTNLCPKYPIPLNGLMPDGTSRMSFKGQMLYHSFSCSTWAQYTVVNVNYVFKVDARVPLAHASILSCGYTTGFGAAWKEAKVEKGSTVAVFGLGGVGLGVIEGARTMGASKIIGVDINEKKREKGKVFGMTDFINPRETDKPISEVIREVTGGLGVDYSFECSGVSSLLNEALDATILGRGVTIMIGAVEAMTVPISVIALMGCRTLKGSLFGGIKPPSDLPIIVDKCIQKELEIEALVTHEVQFDNINHAIELSKQPDCVKVIIHLGKK